MPSLTGTPSNPSSMRPDPSLLDIEPQQHTIWRGLQTATVLLRVMVVVALGLLLFLSVFLGLLTLPLIAPGLLGLGYLGVVVGRKLPRAG